MVLNLENQEVNFILQTLGEMPTKSGCFPLVMKIQEQALKAQEEEKEKQKNSVIPAPLE